MHLLIPEITNHSSVKDIMHQPVKEMISFLGYCNWEDIDWWGTSQKKGGGNGDLGQVNQGVLRAESFCYLFPRTHNDGSGFLNWHCFPGAQGSGKIQHSHLKLMYFILIGISIFLAIYVCICRSVCCIALIFLYVYILILIHMLCASFCNLKLNLVSFRGWDDF